MSGHSKWAQIKHKKAATDAKKGQLFSKIVREIMVAARAGGPAPETNSRLKTAIERARTFELPKENIKRAIERASGSEDTAALHEFLYEATAPGGIAILIEGITDSKNRSLAEIKHILSENGGRLAERGSLLWNFEKIGIIEILKEAVNPKTEEEIELEIIESGAKDWQKTHDGWIVETEFQEIEKVRGELEKRKLNVKNSSYDYKVKAPIKIGDETKNLVKTILNKLSDHDDVQEVYTNINNL